MHRDSISSINTTSIEIERAIKFWDEYHYANADEPYNHNDKKESQWFASPRNERAESETSSDTTNFKTSRDVESESESRRSKEWILRDSPVLLQRIHSTLNSIPASTVSASVTAKDETIPRRILEIGCGTSRLSRSVLEYLRYRANISIQQSSIHHSTNTTDSTAAASAVSFRIIATDVSEVCLRFNRIRDKNFLTLLSHQHHEQQQQQQQQSPHTTTCLLTTNKNSDVLHYQILDITKDNTNPSTTIGNTQSHPVDLPKQQDMILDKGCLDTLLFRRSTRHSNNNTLHSNIHNSNITHLHSPIVTNLLNNVHSMLKPNGGVYFLITPRSKLKSIRDFKGFSSVIVHKIGQLPINGTTRIDDGNLTMEMGQLEHSNTQQQPHHHNKQHETNTSQQCAYIYTCIRNDKYQIGKQAPYADKYRVTVLPQEDETCLKCGVSFLNFRLGEDMLGRGQAYWIRRWRGHSVHCAG